MTNRRETKVNKPSRPPFGEITVEWIEAQKREFNISDYEFSMQVSNNRGYWKDIKSGRTKRINNGIKSAAWQFFQRVKDSNKK